MFLFFLLISSNPSILTQYFLTSILQYFTVLFESSPQLSTNNHNDHDIQKCRDVIGTKAVLLYV
jgi:hypothetical protein